MKEHTFVRVFSVIVVPVNQGGWSTTGELKSVHADDAGNIDLTGGGKHLLAHHGHDGAYIDAIVLLHAAPALDGRRGEAERKHPVVDDDGELRHLHHRFIRCGRRVCIGADMLDPLTTARIVIADGAIEPKTSERSIVLTEIPEASRSFSL